MNDRWMVIERDERLYLYAGDIGERKRLGEGSLFTFHEETTEPMTQRDCLLLAQRLLNHAVRR